MSPSDEQRLEPLMRRLRPTSREERSDCRCSHVSAHSLDTMRLNLGKAASTLSGACPHASIGAGGGSLHHCSSCDVFKESIGHASKVACVKTQKVAYDTPGLEQAEGRGACREVGIEGQR